MDICRTHNKTSHTKDGSPYLVKGKQLMQVLASDINDVEIILKSAGKYVFISTPHHVLPYLFPGVTATSFKIHTVVPLPAAQSVSLIPFPTSAW